MESSRRYAGHGVDLAVDVDAPAGNLAISAEAALPERMAQHHDVRPRLFFLRQKAAPQFRLHAQKRKQVPRNDLPFRLNGRQRIGQSEPATAVADQMLKGMVARAEIEERGVRQIGRVAAPTPVEGSHRYQPVRPGERQGPQHHGIYHRENGRAGANPQSQRQGRRSREPPRFAKLSQGVAHILKQYIQGRQSAPFA